MHTGTATLVSPQCRKLYNTEQPSNDLCKEHFSGEFKND